MEIVGGDPDYINMFILIIISTLNASGYTNNAVTFQEFNSMQQCQYVASVIKKQAETPHKLNIFCVNK